MTATLTHREQMNIVIVGHVDHGKSTVIGRLLADTGSLPDGKLEQVKAMCARNARPFEYAFLLDALKNEQAQGITIDTARCFFKTDKRNYILNDAPGHIEFLKNMVTGAARAEAALLVIDAAEGIQENSKRHGYMMSLLGVRQVAVLINKMDLAGYRQQVYQDIRAEYQRFLDHLGVNPVAFIPVSAREGINITQRSPEMPWWDGPSVLEQVDAFARPIGREGFDFRLPVQDIYKFTALNDDRRVVAGTIETGSIAVGEEVVFYPSQKRSVVKSIETFNAPARTAIDAGHAAGLTLTTQIYIKPGELMVKASQQPPLVGTRFRATLFWMGRAPLVKNRNYLLKIGAAKVNAQLAEINNVLDASELSSIAGKQQIDRHDVAECVIETSRPIAFDRRNDLEATGRFVLVDDHEIAGCGIVLEPVSEDQSLIKQQVNRREFNWEKGSIAPADREARFQHQGKFIIFNGPYGCGKRELARRVERHLFQRGCQTYYFGIANLFETLDRDDQSQNILRDENIGKLGELAHVMTDAGLLFITTIAGVDDHDLEKLKLLNKPHELFVVNIGENEISRYPVAVALSEQPDLEKAVDQIVEALTERKVIIDFVI